MVKSDSFTSVKWRFRSVFGYYLRFAVYINPTVQKWMAHRFGHTSDNRSPAFWDSELKGTKAPYLKARVSSDIRYAITAKLIRNFAPGAQSLLDVGCAGGRLALAVSGEGLKRYVGIDISEYATRKAREIVHEDDNLRSVRFYAGDLFDFTPPGNDLFDVIAFNEVLYYLDIDEAVEQLDRYQNWLKPNGVFCISMKDHPKSHAIYRAILKQYQLLYGVLCQGSPDRMKYRIYITREHAAFLLCVFRPIRNS